MTNQHPITPPPELALQWINEYLNEHPEGLNVEVLVVSAAQWGADQQLAKDAEWLDRNALHEPHLRITPVGESLKEAMRPKPPSLKEQALEELDELLRIARQAGVFNPPENIRRALETLPND